MVKKKRYGFGLLALLATLSVVGGGMWMSKSGAYFTDNDSGKTAPVRAGKSGLAIGKIDTSFAESVDQVQEMHWGDYAGFSFEVENNGNLALDTNTTIKVTSPKKLNWNDFSKQFSVYKKSDTELSNGVYSLKPDAKPVEDRTVVEDGIILQVPNVALSGSSLLRETQPVWRHIVSKKYLSNADYQKLPFSEKRDYEMASDTQPCEYVFHFGDYAEAVDLIFTAHSDGVTFGNKTGWKDSDEFVRYGKIAYNPYRNMLESGKKFNAHIYEMAGLPQPTGPLEEIPEKDHFPHEIYIGQYKLPTEFKTYDVSHMQDGSVLAWFDPKHRVYNNVWYPAIMVTTATYGETVKGNFDMSYMFTGVGAPMYMTDIDTQNTTDMSYMFANTKWYNIADKPDLSILNYANVENMDHMFYRADFHCLMPDVMTTDKVTNMAYMFKEARLLSENRWKMSSTSNVTKMDHMYEKTVDINMILDFDTSKVVYMDHMFDNGNALEYKDNNTFSNIDYVTKWNTSNVIDMRYMFRNALRYPKGENPTIHDITFDFSQLDVSNVTNMAYMFADNGHYDLRTIINLSNWNASKVLDMSHMFEGFWDKAGTHGIANGLYKLVLDGIQTNSCKNMSYMFSGIETDWDFATLDLRELDTENVEDMSYIFYKSNFKNIDVSTWNTAKVKNFAHAFDSCIITSNTTIDVSKWDTSSAEDMSYMFANTYNTLRSTMYGIRSLDVTNFKTANVKNMAYMFCGYYGKMLDVANWDVNMCNDFSFMFQGCFELSLLDVSRWTPNSATTMRSMFQQCTKLTQLDTSGFSMNKVTDTVSMFESCKLLKTIHSTTWDMSKVADMTNMFKNCEKLTTLDATNWNVANVTSMKETFYNTRYMKNLDVSKWNVGKVVDMTGIFQGCGSYNSAWTLDVSNWNTSNVECMNCAFKDTSFSDIPLLHWNTSKVKTMRSMFEKSHVKRLDLHLWDVSNLTDATQMFYDAINCEVIDLSDWNFTKKPIVQFMFGYYSGYVPQLRTIYASDWTKKVTDADKMFLHAWDLVGNGLAYEQNNLMTSSAYASKSGYFTEKPDKSIPNVLKDFMGNLPYRQCSKVVFTNTVDTTKTLTDLSVHGDNTVVGWQDGSTYYIGSRDGGKIQAMSCAEMFTNCGDLRFVDFSNLDTSRVSNMAVMFFNCQYLQSITTEHLKTDNVISMASMFEKCSYYMKSYDVTNWNVAKVTTFRRMFAENKNLQELKGIENWNTSNLIDCAYFLQNCIKIKDINLSNWDVSKVIDMSGMFKVDFESDGRKDETLRIFLTNWKPSNALKMANDMFNNKKQLTYIYCDNDWGKTATSASASNMFANLSSHITGGSTKKDFSMANPNTGYFTSSQGEKNILVTGSAFALETPKTAKNIVFDYSLQVPSGVETVDLSHHHNGSVIGWLDGDTFYVTTADCQVLYANKNSAYMFKNNLSNVALSSIIFKALDTTRVETMREMFSYQSELKTLDLSAFDTQNLRKANSMFEKCKGLTYIVGMENWNVEKLEDANLMFYQNASVYKLDLSGWNPIAIKSTEHMFGGCAKLGRIYATDWVNVTAGNGYNMFVDCLVLEGKVPYSKTSVHGNMANMNGYFTDKNSMESNVMLPGPAFSSYIENDYYNGVKNVVIDGAQAIPQDIALDDLSMKNDSSVVGWVDPDGVTYRVASPSGTIILSDMNAAFWHKQYLHKVTFGNVDSTRMTNMSSMFGCCENLKEVDVTQLDTSNVTSMYQLFYRCYRLESLNLQGWNTAKVQNMNRMFYVTGVATLDLTEFDISSLTTADEMFYCCNKLTTIYATDWSVLAPNVTGTNVFTDCKLLLGAKPFDVNATGWEETNTTTGYFTAKPQVLNEPVKPENPTEIPVKNQVDSEKIPAEDNTSKVNENTQN